MNSRRSIRPVGSRGCRHKARMIPKRSGRRFAVRGSRLAEYNRAWRSLPARGCAGSCACHQFCAGGRAGSISGHRRLAPPRRSSTARRSTDWRPTKFSGQGAVKAENGTIVLAAGNDLTGVTWAGAALPTTNYELTLQAMRVEGNDFFAGITFPVDKSFCSLILGGWGGTVVGLSSINDLDASENSTSQSMVFEKQRWYTRAHPRDPGEDRRAGSTRSRSSARSSRTASASAWKSKPRSRSASRRGGPRARLETYGFDVSSAPSPEIPSPAGSLQLSRCGDRGCTNRRRRRPGVGDGSRQVRQSTRRPSSMSPSCCRVLRGRPRRQPGHAALLVRALHGRFASKAGTGRWPTI